MNSCILELKNTKFFREKLKQKCIEHFGEPKAKEYYKEDFAAIKEFVPNWGRFRRIVVEYLPKYKP